MPEFANLAEVREHIDALDSRIVPLLAERATLVAQAACFKPSKNLVVDAARAEQVVLRIRHLAREAGADPDLVEHIYRAMMDAYVVYEAQEWKRVHGS